MVLQNELCVFTERTVLTERTVFSLSLSFADSLEREWQTITRFIFSLTVNISPPPHLQKAERLPRTLRRCSVRWCCSWSTSQLPPRAPCGLRTGSCPCPRRKYNHSMIILTTASSVVVVQQRVRSSRAVSSRSRSRSRARSRLCSFLCSAFDADRYPHTPLFTTRVQAADRQPAARVLQSGAAPGHAGTRYYIRQHAAALLGISQTTHL